MSLGVAELNRSKGTSGRKKQILFNQVMRLMIVSIMMKLLVAVEGPPAMLKVYIAAGLTPLHKHS